MKPYTKVYLKLQMEFLAKASLGRESKKLNEKQWEIEQGDCNLDISTFAHSH